MEYVVDAKIDDPDGAFIAFAGWCEEAETPTLPCHTSIFKIAFKTPLGKAQGVCTPYDLPFCKWNVARLSRRAERTYAIRHSLHRSRLRNSVTSIGESPNPDYHGSPVDLGILCWSSP
jgi:hypothetical protein